MRLARLYVILALVCLAACEQPTDDDEATAERSARQDDQVEEIEEAEEEPVENDEDTDTLKIQDPLDPNNSQLSILPPIVLLDFGNGDDDDDDNSTSSDEKSKRTIDGNLGYGFARNNLFSGKTNYYFPAGKTGTTVSIEESISPFQPKTIIENVKPISEKPQPGEQNSGYGQNPLQQVKTYQAASGQQANRPSQGQPQGTNNQAPSASYPQQIFGQRTKLYKPSQIDYSGYQGFSSTPKSTVESYTTPRPDYRVSGFAASHQNAFTTPKPSYSSTSFASGFPQGSYTTQRPFVSYSTTASPSYVTPTPSPYQTRYTANSANSFGTPRPSFGVTTPRPTNLGPSQDSPLAPFSNLPRYTVENGVRYENKIVWKYADGKISQTPPTSYINAYNEFLSNQNPGAGPSGPGYPNIGGSQGFPNSGASGSFPNPGSSGSFSNPGSSGSFPNPGSSGSFPNPGSSGSFSNSGSIGSYQTPGAGVSYQNIPGQPSTFQNPIYQTQFVRYQSPQDSRYPAESLGNIHSKSPAQFPKDQELGRPSRPSQFVSAASLQAANAAAASRAPQGQTYDQGYQGQFGLKTSQRLANPASSTSYSGLLQGNTKLLKDPYYRPSYERERLIPKYAVNSPNPEYTYSTESSVKSSTPSSTSLLTPSGTLSPNILAKYSTQAQKYLSKVFTPERSTVGDFELNQPTSPSPPRQSFSSQPNPYINTDYEHLLNYNPSISQYIRNPASILKAQPTYIQAGNSLIPVIILRVDGAPPIQPKVTPNINLKALLQQYLTQYAGSISQNGKGNFGGSEAFGKTSPQNSLYQLNQLAQSLTQYSQDPSIANTFSKQFDGGLSPQSPYETSNSFQQGSSYDGLDKAGGSGGSSSYGSRTNKPQKIKSVQIIEDPRFTSYKVRS